MGERETEGDQIRQVNNLPLVLDFTPPACVHQKADSVNTTGEVFMKQWTPSLDVNHRALKNRTFGVIVQGIDF